MLILSSSACNRHLHKETVETFKLVPSTALDMNKSLNLISFGSCNKEWTDQSYWNIIQKDNPDLWIWLGDIIYADTENMEELKARYDGLKNNNYYSSLRSQVPIIGIWDDHDYGVNDGGYEYPMKKESKRILFDFLDVPLNNKDRQHDGAYQSYTIGEEGQKVKIILLDTRYFRDELKKNTEGPQRYLVNKTGTILGEDQWNWFENELVSSDADVHLIASGIQFLQEEQCFEKWTNFPKEHARLLQLLGRKDVHNVVLLSGDRHISELAKKTIGSNDIFEITSSGLTHSYDKNTESNRYRMSPIIGVKSFSQLKFDWQQNKVLIDLEFLDMDGNVIYQYNWDYKTK